jgi:hypothetical protein
VKSSLVGMLAIACAIGVAGCGPVNVQRARIKVQQTLRPRKISGFHQVKTYLGEMVCGYVDLAGVDPGLSRRRFVYNAINGGVWVSGRAATTPDRSIYAGLDQRIWNRCMGQVSDG